MEPNAGLEPTQPERGVAADDVQAVPAAREALRQLGRDDAASTDRRVADDADVHREALGVGSREGAAPGSLNRCGRSSRSLTMTPSANEAPTSAPNWASRLSMSCWKQGEVSRVGTAPGADRSNWLR